MIAEAWNKTLAPILDRMAQKGLDSAFTPTLLPNISRLDVTQFKFGTNPPRVQYIRLLNSSVVFTSEYGMVKDLDPGDLARSDKKLLLLEMGVGFKSVGSSMKASFEKATQTFLSFIPLPRKRLPALLSLSNLAIQATVVLLLEIQPQPPFFQVCRFCFSERPDITFSLRPLSSLDVTALPVISQTLDYLISRNLAGIVNPHYVEIKPP